MSYRPNVPAAAVPVVSRLMTFDNIAAQLTVVDDLVFGTGVTAGTGQTAIRTLSDVSTLFNALEDFTQSTTVNSELQRYQPIGAATHQLLSDRINLVASLDTSAGYTGGYPNAQVAQTAASVTLPGTVAMTSLGWAANGGGRAVGQLFILQYVQCMFVITGFSGANVTIAALSGGNIPAAGVTVSGNLNVTLPQYAVACTSAPGGTTLQFGSALPAGIKVGMQVGYWAAAMYRSNDVRVVSISAGGAVTVSTGLDPQPAGLYFIFMPPIISGQIWSKKQYDLCRDDCVWGFDFDVVLPTDSAGGYNTRGISSLAAFNAAPTDFPWGDWPALWLYSADTGNALDGDVSELDFIERFDNSTGGPFVFYGNDHSPLNVNDLFRKASEGWTKPDTYYGELISPTALAGSVRISCVYTPRGRLSFVNGKCIKQSDFRWTATRPAQVGMNLAFGSLSIYLAPLLMVPMSSSNFAQGKFGIKRMRVYNSNPYTPPPPPPVPTPTFPISFTGGTLPTYVTFARPSEADALTVAGVLTRFGSGVPAMTDRGILVEPAGTSFINVSGAQLIDLTKTTVVGPDGTSTAIQFTEATDTSGTAHLVRTYTSPAIVAGLAMTLSGYIKRSAGTRNVRWQDGNDFHVILDLGAARATVTLGNGVSASATTQNGWVYFQIHWTAVSPSGAIDAFFTNDATGSDGSIGYVGDGASGLMFAGIQAETGLVATSTMVGGTRAAGALSFTVPAGKTSLTYTFDDNSSATATVTAGIAYSVPTNLARPYIKSIA